jgi:hypothetical protein
MGVRWLAGGVEDGSDAFQQLAVAVTAHNCLGYRLPLRRACVSESAMKLRRAIEKILIPAAPERSERAPRTFSAVHRISLESSIQH